MSCRVCGQPSIIIADYPEQVDIELCRDDYDKEHWHIDAKNVRVVQ